MSIWRDIWRYGVIANRLFAENEQDGEVAFEKLHDVYDRAEKDGKDRRDGMIRYIEAEAYESKYWTTNRKEFKEKALEGYIDAEKLFPVEHWKKIARDSHDRVQNETQLQEFYRIKIKRSPLVITGKFDELLWYGFQKVYTFTHLNDFARYICLSALSRGSSEWPLSLIDFRTVLEIEIKRCFMDLINDHFKDENSFSLQETISILDLPDKSIREAFDNIRKAGNLATHAPEVLKEEYKTENVVRFIDVLSFFDDYERKNSLKGKDKKRYPLCQLTLAGFKEKLDEEKKQLEKNDYYD